MAAAIGASRRELRRADAEQSGQLLDFPGGESSLSAVAVTFGSAHGGGAWPAHQLAELRLGPPPALTEDTNVRTGDGALLLRDLAYRAAPSCHHVLGCFASTA
jgi:hypothetical protein